MESVNQPSQDFLDYQPERKSGTLNVLTILTFIGCGIGFLGVLWGEVNGDNYERTRQDLEKMQEKGGTISEVAKSSIDMLEKTQHYRYELLVTGIISLLLCLVGAIMMRKLRKNGFYIYLVGEVGPIIINLALLGVSFMSGITTAISAVIALVFVVLYATQLKYMR